MNPKTAPFQPRPQWMDHSPSHHWSLSVLLVLETGFAVLIPSALLELIFNSQRWNHVALHSGLETASSVVALILAPLLLTQSTESPSRRESLWIASCLLALGALDLSHAFMDSGVLFFLTRSLANFFGGVIASLVWLQLTPAAIRKPHVQRIPYLIAGATAAVASSLHFLPQLEQTLGSSLVWIENATGFLNVLGVCGYVSAAAYFLLHLRHESSRSNQARARTFLLLAASAILFGWAPAWSANWWLFHVVKLAAPLILLRDLIFSFQTGLQSALLTQVNLEKQVEKRTELVETANARLQKEVQERAESQTELRRIRAQLEAVLESINDGVMVFDRDSKVVFLNGTDKGIQSGVYETWIGQKAEYFFSRYELFDLDNHEIPGPDWPLARILRGETVEKFTCRAVEKNSRVDWFLEISGKPVWDGKGQLSLGVIITRDVTELKRSELHLKASEAHLRKFSDFMPQISWICSADGTPTYFNQRWFDYTGMKESNLQDLPDWADWIHSEDFQRVNQCWSESLESFEVFESEFRLRRHDGDYRWHLARAVPFQDGSIAPQWFGTCTDIHDQVELLEKVKSSEAQLSIAVSAAEIGTWKLDLKSMKVTASPIINKMAALEPGRTLFDLHELKSKVFWEDQKKLLNLIHAAIEHKKDFIHEFRITRSSREVRWVYCRGRAIYDRFGNPECLHGASIDVTERRQTEERLRNAVDRANEANQLKSAFLANMSHEIRTPLGAILGFTELLREDNLSSEDRDRFFEVIDRNGQQLSTLINDILDLSKVESGHFDVETLETDIRAVLEEVHLLHRIKAEEKGLSLSFEVDPHVPKKISTDPTRFKQILNNVVGNAVKFTSSGHVRSLAFVDSTRQLIVRIEDTGLGLSETQIEKLFQPFSQADSSTTRKYGGTGLGLVLSKKLAKALGGDLTIAASTPGVGSVFEIRIADLASPPVETVRV